MYVCCSELLYLSVDKELEIGSLLKQIPSSRDEKREFLDHTYWPIMNVHHVEVLKQ